MGDVGLLWGGGGVGGGLADARRPRALFMTSTDAPFMCVCKIDGWPELTSVATLLLKAPPLRIRGGGGSLWAVPDLRNAVATAA